MSIERYLAVNLIADMVLLGMVSRILGLFSWKRTLACGSLCALYAALAAAHPAPWSSPPIQAALVAVVALALAGRTAPRLWAVVAMSTASVALLCGGIAGVTGLSGAWATPICIGGGLLLSSLLFSVRPPVQESWQVRLQLTIDGKSARFPALIDTGNRIREPLSGLPVLIAEAALLEGLLPESGYRILRFGAVGGEGSMACFKPSAIWIERGLRRRRAPQVWVALSPGPLPGLYQALAPPEFALYNL